MRLWLRGLNMKKKIYIIAFLLFALLLGGCSSSGERYNVIVITVDTLRADHLGIYGYDKLKTPAMDRTGKTGWLYRNAYAPTPLTLPSHSTIFTGEYPFTHGVRNNATFVLPDSTTTLAEILKKEGYKTGACISAHVLDSQYGLAQGFDFYDDSLNPVHPGAPVKIAEEANTTALNWLSKNEDTPFFFWLHYFDPHDPYMAPEPYGSRYKDTPYDGEVAYTDHQLSLFLDKLKSRGLYDETIIVFTSDHGESLMEHDEKTHGLFAYNSTLRVPLMIRVPETEHREINPNVSHIDILPTLLDILNINPKKKFRGQSLASKNIPDNRTLYGETLMPHLYFGWSALKTVISGDKKYIHSVNPELYDLEKDPGETDNIISKNPDTARKLNRKLEKIQIEKENKFASKKTPLSKKELNNLRALGYLSGRGDSSAKKEELFTGADPKEKTALFREYQKAMSLDTAGKTQEAIRAYKELLSKLKGHGSRVHLYLGNIYYKNKDYHQALKHYKKTLDVYSDDPKITFVCGKIAKKLGKKEEAEKFWRKSLKLNPDTKLVYLKLGTLLSKSNQLQEAAEILRKGVSKYPDDSPLLNTLGITYFKMRKVRMAMRLFQEAIKADKEAVQPHQNLVYAYLKAGRIEEAKRHLDKAEKLAPDNKRNQRLKKILEKARENQER